MHYTIPYTTPSILSSNQGNNSFSYDRRKELLGTATITIPTIKTIKSVDQVILGDTVVFEEIDHNDHLHKCTGLRHLYRLQSSHKPIVIMDNHHHALYARRTHRHYSKQSFPVIHIDQHSDLGKPLKPITQSHYQNATNMYQYVNYGCTIGSFIQPALQAGIIQECVQIRTQQCLLNHTVGSTPYILDIDLDFWAPEMGIENFDKTTTKTKQLITHASMITIATSPFFIDQHEAVKILYTLLG